MICIDTKKDLHSVIFSKRSHETSEEEVCKITPAPIRKEIEYLRDSNDKFNFRKPSNFDKLAKDLNENMLLTLSDQEDPSSENFEQYQKETDRISLEYSRQPFSEYNHTPNLKYGISNPLIL